MRPFWASIIAYGCAFGAAYLGQKIWAFRSTLSHRVSLPRYAALQLGCALFAAAVTELASLFGNYSPLYTSALATVLVSVVSYFVSLLWVFADTDRAR